LKAPLLIFLSRVPYAMGELMNALDYGMGDAELIDKFMRNTRRSLNEYHAQEMIAIIQNLENLGDITELFRLATIT
jgi:hypothetical protein